ncbi:MAG: hypothetical protein ABI402_02660 [Ferruginibacter sp.]
MNKQETADFTEEGSRLPSGLNTLTILTIIACIFGYLRNIYSYFSSNQENYNKTREMIDSGKVPDWLKFAVNEKTLAIQEIAIKNKLPLLILGVVAISLCLYGAIEMRKRKKQGYILWLVGEILPIFTGILFMGSSSFLGSGLIFLIIPLIFIILYTVNRKDLIY